MKKCTYCGKEYPDMATVCELDANPLVVIKGANAEPPPTVEMNWLDKFFTNSSGFFFWGASANMLLGMIGVLACKHPTARKKAWIFFGWEIMSLVLALIIIVIVKNIRGR
jgi:hypothetical protein